MTDVDGLDVYLHGDLAGTLERLSQARLRFTYDSAWVDVGRQPLSLSLPVRRESYEHDECAPFFEGLLPEGDFLRAIAQTLHVSATNSFQLLTELGGECAGAISVAPAGGLVPGHDPRAPRWLGEAELAALLADLPTRPLIAAIDEEADGGGFRLSLAGAHSKVGVLADGERIGLSFGMPPTTDILKAPIPHVHESVANEAFCMSLAAHVDLDVASAQPRIADAHEYLLVHRYDRGPEPPDGRIHQEDFCQALGLVPAVKYEREGGPTVADCANLIRRHCSAPARDITAFLDALLLNFAIANHDGHSKNYSLLLDGPGAVRLAPRYDLVSTAVYRETDRKLAMRYGGENRPAYVRGRHLDRLAADLGVKPVLVRRRAVAMSERITTAVDAARESLPAEFRDRPILDSMVALIRERIDVLAERAVEAGGPPGWLGTVDEGPELELPDPSLIAAGFDRLNEDLDRAGQVLRDIGADRESLPGGDPTAKAAARAAGLAGELGAPSLRVKQHGRDIFDATVELDSVIEPLLVAMADEPAPDRARVDLLASLTEIAAAAAEASATSETLYAAITEIEGLSAALRPAVRNMRAGVRDVLDAQAIVAEWGRRAEVLGAQR